MRPYTGDHHGAEVINGRFYLFGGLDVDEAQNGVQIFDPASGTWSTGATIPFNAGSPSTALIGGFVYVCGGIDDAIGKTHNMCAK